MKFVRRNLGMAPYQHMHVSLFSRSNTFAIVRRCGAVAVSLICRSRVQSQDFQ